jgi:hypothetical protein
MSMTCVICDKGLSYADVISGQYVLVNGELHTVHAICAKGLNVIKHG